MNRRSAALLLFGALISFTSAFAQQPSPYPYPVELVRPSTSDSVGGRLAYAIRQKLAASSTLRLVDNSAPLALEVHLLSIDTEANTKQQGLRTTYSIVWTLRINKQGTFYLNATMGAVGSTRVDDAAADIVAQTDETLRGVLNSASSDKQ